MIVLARPSHFIKNGFVFVPLFFAHRLTDLSSLAAVVKGFAGFCLAAGAVYVFNDIVDRAKDADHPVKRARPIAAGEVSVARALALCLFLSGMAGVFCLLLFQADYFMVILLYMALNLLYSFKLQDLAFIGAGCVAAGFVLRVYAGAAVIDVPVSYWLAGLTFLLALFLAFAKRRCEIMGAGGATANGNRLSRCPGMIFLAVISLAGYVAYTLSPAVIREHGAPGLYLTSVWVALGFVRYFMVGFNPVGDCSPVSVLLRDRLLQIVVLLWIISLWWMMYMAGS